MKVIRNIKEMRTFSNAVRKAGKSIVFAPTMGCLHRGHVSLLEKGRSLGDVLVLSIFVNPLQFGPKEDYASYPRDFNADLTLAEANRADVVFSPDAEEMYPDGYETYVEVERLSRHLCGLSRPGHFRGVATVVAKLFNIIMPDTAIFGEKDFQQLMIIKRMAQDLNIGVNIVSAPTIREPDGLALSSRNNYLNREERKAALCLYNAIKRGKDIFESGVKDVDIILKEVKRIVEAEPLAVIDYVKVCGVDTLEDVDIVADKALMAMAVRIGKTRLIDNCILG